MRLTAALRNGVPALFSTAASLFSSLPSRTASSRFPVPAAPPLLLGLWRRGLAVPLRFSSFATPLPASGPTSSSFENDTKCVAVPMGKQFVEFQTYLEESQSVREGIRVVMMKMKAAIAVMESDILLLLLHESGPVPEVLAKVGNQVGVLKQVFGRIGEILRECPNQYYRYHGDWRSQTQTLVSMLAFFHWLETGNLLTHREVEEKLGLDASGFVLDIEDYLIGLCFMSNELPSYVVNRVRAGEHDCPRKVRKFLTDLHASFRMLINDRNDFLRRKFDGMKCDLMRVEEVLYLVKIGGLASET